MTRSYYLGTLELLFEEEYAYASSDFNKKFLEPVLRKRKRAEISVIPTAQLNVLFPVKNGKTRMEWSEDGREYCAFEQQGKWLSVSRLDPDGNVRIWVRKEGKALFRASFRPWYQIHLEKLMLRNQALILHAASIEYRGKAILFTAPSGTGKTTQTDLWHSFAKDVSDLNGDRTLLQRTEDGWYACGFPIYGSSMRCEQKALRIAAIVVVRRAEMDSVQELSPIQRVTQLFSQMMVPSVERYVVTAMELIEELVGQTRIVQLNCTMNRSAVETLHQYLYGEKLED